MKIFFNVAFTQMYHTRIFNVLSQSGSPVFYILLSCLSRDQRVRRVCMRILKTQTVPKAWLYFKCMNFSGADLCAYTFKWSCHLCRLIALTAPACVAERPSVWFNPLAVCDWLYRNWLGNCRKTDTSQQILYYRGAGELFASFLALILQSHTLWQVVWNVS